MSWIDRLRALTYTSPTGREFTFKFEDLESSFEKKGEAIDFINSDETLSRDYGASARQFPVRLFITGGDCDLTARDFDNAIHEKGFGRLEYPLQGTFDVTPIGKVTRRDDLASAANQVVFELTFFETTDLLGPSRSEDPGRQVADYSAAYETAVSAEVAAKTAPSVEVPKENLKQNFLKNLNGSKNSLLSSIKKASQKTRKFIFDTYAMVEGSIDGALDDPYSLAVTTILTVKALADAPEQIAGRFSNYGDMLRRITGTSLVPKISTVADGPKARTDFAQNVLYAGAALSGQVTAAIGEPYKTRGDALRAALELIDNLDIFRTWVELNVEALASLGVVNDYDDQDLVRAVHRAAGNIIDLSFGLLQEREIILDRPWGLVPLAARIYGDPERVDDLIISNNLTGSEILEIPRGRRIVYYN